MKETCVKLFSFRAEEYHSMEQFLEEMLKDGWRLRWCKGTLAGFEKTDQRNLRYIVDPYAVTSPMNLRRFPKFRLQEYMENGWYGAGKSKGCYIFYTDNNAAVAPNLEPQMAVQVRQTCKISSLVFAILLGATLWKCVSTPAVLYSILLTDIYIVFAAVAAFLTLYHLVNVLLLSQPQRPVEGIQTCKRYVFHDLVLFLFLVTAILLQARHQSGMLLYLLLPILVIAVGTFFLLKVSRKTKDAQDSNRKLIPIVCVMGIALLILIPLSVNRLQNNSREAGSERQQQLLAQAGDLPVLHLQDVAQPTAEVVAAVKENRSILGENLLFAEESAELSIFTNRIAMQSKALADPMFHYLYLQAQIDYNESFQQKEYQGVSYYELEKSNTYLLQRDAIVYLGTIPNSADSDAVLDLLLSD